MFRKNLLSTLFVLTFPIFFTGLAMARDQVPGSESDRGTLRTPDLVATPHTGDDSGTIEDEVMKHVPNRSLAEDKNGDGLISRDEWKGRPADFNRLDTNQDGMLSPRELDAYIQIGLDEFAELDLNHDGVISREEWKSPMAFFDDLDTNRDGRLTRSEFYGGSKAPVGNMEPENR